MVLTLGAQLVGHQGREACFPLAHRFMREFEAPLQAHLREIPPAEFVPHTPEHDQENDVGREFEIIEGRARALIALPPASSTAKDALAKLRSLGQFSRGSGSTVRAGHLVLLQLPVSIAKDTRAAAGRCCSN